MRPMATNGGPHPADKWADVTTDAISDLLVDGNPDAATPEALAARQAKRDLKPKLFAIFNDHHTALQAGEAKAPQGLDAPIEIVSETAVALAQVNKVLAATPFAAHFAQPNVQAVLTQIIGQHSTDVVHIERRWAADRKAA
jgi:hypothetical protein